MAILPANPESYDKSTIEAILKNVIQLSLTLAGGIAVIYLIIGAFHYFTAFGSFGDKEKQTAAKGKATITWAIVGIVVIILAKVIIMEVWKLLSGAKSPFLY